MSGKHIDRLATIRTQDLIMRRTGRQNILKIAKIQDHAIKGSGSRLFICLKEPQEYG